LKRTVGIIIFFCANCPLADGHVISLSGVRRTLKFKQDRSFKCIKNFRFNGATSGPNYERIRAKHFKRASENDFASISSMLRKILRAREKARMTRVSNRVELFVSDNISNPNSIHSIIYIFIFKVKFRIFFP